MRYTVRIKCLVPFHNDEVTFTQHIEPSKLGAFVRGIAKKLTDCDAWFTDEYGKECARIKRKAIGFREFRLRELTMNGNRIYMGG